MFKSKLKYNAQHRDDYLQDQICKTDRQIRNICFNLAVFYLKDKDERAKARVNISEWYSSKFIPQTYCPFSNIMRPEKEPNPDDLIKLQKIAFELDNNE